MKSRIPWANAAGLLTAGVALGLTIGAWRWRGAEREGTTARTDEPADIGRPPLLGRGADGAGVGRPAPGGRAETEPDPVSAAVIKVNALKSSGKSGKMLAHAEMMAAVGALDAAQCARLLETLAESGEWDPESAIYPLLHWATRDPAAALNFALGHQDFQSTERVLAEIVHALAKSDLDAALLALGQMEGEEREASQIAIVNALVETDLDGALAQARAFSNPKAEAVVFEAWAARDPRAAAAAFDPASTGLHDAAQVIAKHLAQSDRAAFNSWAASLTDPKTRGVARSTAISLDSKTNPAEAAREYAEWIAADPAANAIPNDNLVRFIAQRWLLDGPSPGDVAAWAVAHPEGASREAAIGSVGEQWFRIDPAAASAWLAELPASQGKDQAIVPLVRALWDDAPADAFAWARAIQDAETRFEQLQKSARFWHSADPAAAAAAIEALPVEDRAMVKAGMR